MMNLKKAFDTVNHQKLLYKVDLIIEYEICFLHFLNHVYHIETNTHMRMTIHQILNKSHFGEPLVS